MKITDKLLSESTRDTITAYLGFFGAIAALVLFIFKFEYFLAAFILLVYLLLPPIYAIVDMIKGKLVRNPVNLLVAVIYNYLLTFYDILSILVLVPVIAIDFLIGPMSIILFLVGAMLLAVALVQSVSGNLLGASDMTDPEVLVITVPLTVVTASLLYLNYFLCKNKLTQKLADLVLGTLRTCIEKIGNVVERCEK